MALARATVLAGWDVWAHDESQHPALLVNAQDDPFLSEACFPRALADANPCFHLEAPEHGGHVGFVTLGSDAYWSERRAVEFAEVL
jgi:predicted alpha/beta-fold hydrolase